MVATRTKPLPTGHHRTLLGQPVCVGGRGTRLPNPDERRAIVHFDKGHPHCTAHCITIQLLGQTECQEMLRTAATGHLPKARCLPWGKIHVHVQGGDVSMHIAALTISNQQRQEKGPTQRRASPPQNRGLKKARFCLHTDASHIDRPSCSTAGFCFTNDIPRHPKNVGEKNRRCKKPKR